MPASLALLLAFAPAVFARDAFVFLGATGDNALRPSGVWSGLYEAFAAGVFNKDSVGIHVALNVPHTVDEMNKEVVASLTPLYQELKQNKGWKCLAEGGDCSPQRLLKDVVVNIWKDRDPNAQAADMKASLTEYERITVYLSIPPFAFGSWSEAAVLNWGQGAKHRVHVAAEKPFGTSLADADRLHKSILDAGVPENNLHLVDHWLSFFMIRNMPIWRGLVERMLGIDFSSKGFSRIVITEFETRGLDGRGGFFDGVGQVRDMVQSHLLQVMALALVDPDAKPRSDAKLAIFKSAMISSCDLAQYDGFLLEPKLKFHNASADATLCKVALDVGLDAWKNVKIIIQTGKDMGELSYTVDFHQRDGNGILTYEVGKEETGVAGIKVANWPLANNISVYGAPFPGFDPSKTWPESPPEVSSSGNGYLLNYNKPGIYFPKPYAMMVAALLKADYSAAFVTYPECHESWRVVTARGDRECLDPPPENVKVYTPPASCGNKAPSVCFKKWGRSKNQTVQDIYDFTFSCTAAHDTEFKNISIYQSKCHPKPKEVEMVV